jgi:hypothetical protein
MSLFGPITTHHMLAMDRPKVAILHDNRPNPTLWALGSCPKTVKSRTFCPIHDTARRNVTQALGPAARDASDRIDCHLRCSVCWATESVRKSYQLEYLHNTFTFVLIESILTIFLR